MQKIMSMFKTGVKLKQRKCSSFSKPGQVIRRHLAVAKIFLLGNLKQLVNDIRHGTTAAHASAKFRVMDLTVMQGAYLVPYFIKPVWKIFPKPVLEDFSNRSV